MNVLLVEDQEDIRRLFEQVLRARGHGVTACTDGETAWAAYQRGTYPLVLLDWELPGSGLNGLQLCQRIRAHPLGGNSIIVMTTAHNTSEDLLTVLKAGANDYLAKPISLEFLKVRLAIAEQWATNLTQRLQAEAALRESEATALELRCQLAEKGQFCDLIGKSAAMERVYQQIRDIANVDATVLIEGETGTGKELVARAIHFSSRRINKPFIALNCAGLTESLLGSQLFGHKKGSFTGAIEHQQGVFEAAEGGTLFLDEIGDIPAVVQTSLLRVLQEREITRLGETQPRKVDVRIVTATHHDLREDVAKGTFREDLLYRIRVARIHLPPLRERREDIPLLVASFLSQFRAVTEKPVHQLSADAMTLLERSSWPGNVRELKSVIESALIHCKGSMIQVEDLPTEMVNPVASPSHFDNTPRDEKSRVVAALERAKGNRVEAARLLGISRTTLWRRLVEFNLPTDQ